MDTLKELIGLIKKQDIANPATLPIFLRKDKLTNLLYQKLYDNENLSDKEYAQLVYGNAPVGSKFNMLKKRLKDILFPLVILSRLDERNKNTYPYAFFSCYRDFEVARVLIALSAGTSGYPLMRKVLVQSLRYQVFEISLLSLLNLKRYAFLLGDTKVHMRYDKKMSEVISTIAAESEAEQIYFSYMIPMLTRNYIKKETIQEIDLDILKVEELYRKFKTHYLFENLINLQILRAQANSNFQAAGKYCDNYLEYLSNKPHLSSPVRISNAYAYKLESLFYLEDFDAAKECAETSIALQTSGGINWYSIQGIFFLTCLNTGAYEEAARIYSECVLHKQFEKQQSWHRELWDIYGAYLWFLLTWQKNLELRGQTFTKKSFRSVSRLLNDTPIYSQDKKGLNISLIILQILYNLFNGEYNKITSATDRLLSYINDNLEKENFRSMNFIKLIVAVEKSGYDLNKGQKKVEKYLDIIKEGRASITMVQARVEIVRYERLWTIMVDILKHGSSVTE